MSVHRVLPLCAVLVAVGANACGTDPGEPPRVGTVAARLEKVAGDKQSGVVGAELPNRVEVRVVDAEGAVVAGQAVNFVVYSGGGSVSAEAGISDQNGIAGTRWTLGTSPVSAQQVIARLINPRSGGLIHSVTFAATAQAAAATTIEKVAGDLQVGPPSQALPYPLVVRVRDQYGNVKPTAAVEWTALAGGGTPSPSVTRTDGEGYARTQFTLGASLGAQTARAALTTGQSVTFTFTAVTVMRPQGVVDRSDALAARPYAAAVSDRDVVYVTQLDNQRLSRINLPALGEAGSVGVGLTPTDVSFNAAGTRAYVANQFSRNIGVVDVATNTQASTINVPGDAFEVIPNAEDTRLYVVTNSNNLYEIDRASGSVLRSIPIPGTGQSLAFHPNGYLLYVSTFTGGRALEVDTRSMTIVRTFVTGAKAQDVVVSADGTELFVADQDLQKVDVFNLSNGTKITSIPVGGHAWGMAITPDQSQLYVSLLFQGEVAVIDRATRSVVRRIVTGGIPRRIIFNKVGTIAVVPNENGYVTYIR
jgi:YVTN family beta-propeller protein